MSLKFSKLPIGTRLGAAFGAMLVLLTVLCGISVARLTSVGEATQRMVEVGLVNERLATEWAGIIAVNAERTLAAVRFVDSRDEKDVLAAMAANSKRADEIKAAMQAAASSPRAKALLEELAEKRLAYTTVRSAVMKEKSDNGTAAAVVMLDAEMKPKLAAYLASAAAFRAFFQADNDTLAKTVHAEYEAGRNLLFLTNGLALAAGVLLSIWISRGISRPIMRAVTVARTVAASDLRSDVRSGADADSRDEASQLLVALGEMNASLGHVVLRVRQGTDSMSTACQEIASGNIDLSQRTEEQAASLQQTAASMEEITSTVKQNYDNAQRASELAGAASAIAMRGGAKVTEVVGTMGAINGASRKIVEIIGVIDSIAFQTNILALNAAVEAARAGEQGRGFAVVASEVRTLAQRSATAAREIKDLIGASVTQVELGARQADDAGKTMDEIVQSVKRVSSIMAEITNASREQTSGIEQINQAISQMDQVTQQNAAMVEQAAAAAGSLQDQALALSALVGVFKVPPGALPAALPRPAGASGRSPVGTSPDHGSSRQDGFSSSSDEQRSPERMAA